MTRVLITGSGGFSGRALISLLKKHSEFVIFASDIVTCEIPFFRHCDLSNINSVHRLLEEAAPDHIYNLAGSFTNNYDLDYATNVVTTKNILDASLKLNLRARILLIGSAAEYGISREEDNPVTEEHPLNPLSIYGVTKAYQTALMHFYHRVHNCDVVMARPFNILGRGQSNRLFIGRVYEEIEKFKKGEVSHISLGNLQQKRDYLDIHNVIQDYLLIMKHGVSGEIYNVASGKSVKIYDVLKQIIHENGLTMDIVQERSIISPHKFDVQNIYADISKIQGLHQQYAS